MKRKIFEVRKKQLLKSIEDSPSDIENHTILAKFYYMNKCYPETIEIYKKLLQYHPNDLSVQYNLAVAYQANKDLEEAKKMYLEILKADPKHEAAKKGLEKLTTFT